MVVLHQSKPVWSCHNRLLTEWYWVGSLDAFARMCHLRCASDTQYESRIVADQISDVMRDLFPVSWDALLQTGEE
jgi:thymidylate synthase (FAD)